MDKNKAPTINDLFPDLLPQELSEADENLTGYVRLVFGIFERILEKEAQQGALTGNIGTLSSALPTADSSHGLSQ